MTSSTSNLCRRFFILLASYCICSALLVTSFTQHHSLCHHNHRCLKQQKQQHQQKVSYNNDPILLSLRRQQQQQYGLSMGLKSFISGRFRPKRVIEDQKQSSIQIGEQLPNIDIEWIRCSSERSIDDGTTTTQIVSIPISILDVLGSNSDSSKSYSLLVGMPGAFTPTCSKKHLPGYIELATKFQSLCNINTIGIITTNDRYVNEEWTTQYGLLSSSNTNSTADNIIKILSDGDGDFVKSIGLADDMGFGIGIRSKRFAILLNENNIVTKVYTEDDTGLDDCTQTSAYRIFNDIKPNSVKNINDNDESSISINPILILGSAIAIGLAVFISSISGSTSTGSSSTPSSSLPSSSSSSVIRNEPTKAKSSKNDGNFPLLKEYN